MGWSCAQLPADSQIARPGAGGVHPVHDTQAKRYRHLNFFQHECYLEVHVPRVKLPDGKVALFEPDWAGNPMEPAHQTV